MWRFVLSGIVALFLAGCGFAAGEGIAVESNMSKSELVQIFADIDLNHINSTSGFARIERSTPASDEVQFAIQGSDGGRSTVLLRFETLDNGTTRIRATVDAVASAFGADDAFEASLTRLADSGDSLEWRSNFALLLAGLAATGESSEQGFRAPKGSGDDTSNPDAQEATVQQAESSDSSRAEIRNTAEDPNGVSDPLVTSEELTK